MMLAVCDPIIGDNGRTVSRYVGIARLSVSIPITYNYYSSCYRQSYAKRA